MIGLGFSVKMEQAAGKSSSPSRTRTPWEEVKEITTVLSRTVSAFKIFPADHATVQQFIKELAERLSSFLEVNGSLDLTVGENYFSFLGERVFEDEDTARSLPFFFFRDGMQRLSFHRGLREEEIRDFLETIKTVASLPAEEADIVTAFWERNFENISFYAPDEFIIEKIASGRPLPEYHVNRNDLFSGKIELTAEDRKAIEEWPTQSAEAKTSEETEAQNAGSLIKEIYGDFEEDDWKTVESILYSYRHLPSDEELARLLVDIIYLENQPEHLFPLKDSLHRAHEQLINAGKFEAAAAFLLDLNTFSQIFASSFPEKTRLIQTFWQELTENDHLQVIQDSCVKQISEINKTDFISYLRLLGQAGLRVITSLLESIARPYIEEIAIPFLEEWATRDPDLLINLAQESRPYLTLHLIRILSARADRKIITFLAGFISSKIPSLRREALAALARIELPAAQKMLLAFLNDESEDIRILAAENLRVVDETSLEHLLSFVSFPRLKKKSKPEVEALLAALARSNHPRAKDYFHYLFKLRWLLSPKNKKISLAAVAALKKAATPMATQLLAEGRNSHRAELRQACEQALHELQKFNP